MSAVEEAANGGHSTGRDEAVRALGAPVGLRLASLTARAQELVAIQRLREDRTYRQLGYTWEGYCRDVLGRSSNAVEEELLSFSALGEQLFVAAELAGLGRNDLRALRKIPEDARPALLPSGELELGDRRVSLDHREEVRELLEDLLIGQQELRETLARGEEQLRSRDDAVTQLKKEVKELKRAPQVALDLQLHPVARAGAEVELSLSGLLELMHTEQPDPAMVLRIYRRLAPMMSELAQYGGGYEVAPPNTDLLDTDALEEAARALEEAEDA